MGVRMLMACLLLTTSCAPSPSAASAASITRDGGGLWFMGSFDKDTARDLVAQLRPGDTLIIKSPGGEQDAALEVGRAIVERNVSVVVNAECFSACALYVYLPAKNRKINPGGYVWFHNTPDLWRSAIQHTPRVFTDSEKLRINKHYSDTTTLLKSAGIDPNIMRCIDIATKPNFDNVSRSRNTLDSQLNGLPLPAIELGYNFASLSPSTLESFGVKNITEFEYESSAPSNQSLEKFYNVRLAKITSPDICRVPA